MVEKLVRDGKVAVVYSPGYGSGWSSNEHDLKVVSMLLFDRDIALAVLEGDVIKAKVIAISKYKEITGEDSFYTGNGDLAVEWVCVGEKFRIQAYDGSETVMQITDYVWTVAC